MSERIVSGNDTPLELEPGEKRLRDIRSDRMTYLRDHAAMAVLGMGAVGMVLAIMGSDHVFIGSLGAVLALVVRGLWLYSEQMGFRWVLTNQRLVGPGGRQVWLMELARARRLFGDIQLVTRSGDKHLIKHVAQPDDILAAIEVARDKRAKRVKA
jgi:hypothetical protein